MKSKILKSSVFTLIFVTLSLIFSLSASAADGYKTSGNFTYYINGSYAAVTAYKGTTASVTVPSKIGSATVIQISDKVFSGKSEITSVSLPSTLTKIGKNTFNGCTGLTKVVLPSKLKTIGSSAFRSCKNLKVIYIPSSVTSIADNAFTGCTKLTAYVHPSTYAETYVKANGTVKLGYRYATAVRLPSSKATVYMGASVALDYTVTPSNIYNSKVTFTSSDTSVLKVSATGIITPLKCGKATVTVTTADGSKKSAKIVITVVPSKIAAPTQSGISFDGYTISWKKSTGATAYGVYKYDTAEKKWKLIKKTTSRTYTETGLKSGTSNTFRIVPYANVNGTYYTSAASPSVKVSILSPGKVSNVTVKSSNTAVKISWDAAPNATGYQLYRYSEQTKAYTYLGKTEKLSVTYKNLKPNTKYIYAIRAYMLYEGTSIVSDQMVDGIVAYTTPDAVSSFAVDPTSITTSGARLVWDKLSGVSGYEIYSYDENGKYKYTLIARLTSDSITGYTVDSLKSGEIKNFCIRAFIDAETPLYGPVSSIIAVQPASLPETRTEAFNGFITALNASKNSTGDFYLIKTEEISNLSGSYTETCKDVLNTIAHTNVSKHYFDDGIENSTTLPVGSYIKPYNVNTNLKLSQLKSFDYSIDGNGYRITVELGEEQSPAPVNSQIAPTIDWGVVAGQHKNFAIRYCLYEGTVIQAKVHNGRIDDMTITMPINYSFTWNGTDYSFAETITHNYIFGW